MTQQPYFRCDPGNLCEGAKCCSSIETPVTLSVGDYLRLGEATGRSPVEVWHEVGDVSVTKTNEKNQWLILLGLLHDPCPYLTPNLKCGVYDHRPLGCASFPFFSFLFSRSDVAYYTSGGYDCMSNVQLSKDQRRFAQELKGIMSDEASIEQHLFWQENPPVVQLRAEEGIDNYVDQAVSLQMTRDPEGNHQRSKRLQQTVFFIHEHSRQRIPVSMDQYRACLRSIFYVIYRDAITQRFENLDEQAIRSYQGTTARLRRLFKKEQARNPLRVIQR